jgi:hypothetical protein
MIWTGGSCKKGGRDGLSPLVSMTICGPGLGTGTCGVIGVWGTGDGGGVSGCRLSTVGPVGPTGGGVFRTATPSEGSVRCAGAAPSRRSPARGGVGVERGVSPAPEATFGDGGGDADTRAFVSPAASSAGGTDGPAVIWPNDPRPPSPPPAASSTAATSSTTGASAVAPAARAACLLQSRTSSTPPW